MNQFATSAGPGARRKEFQHTRRYGKASEEKKNSEHESELRVPRMNVRRANERNYNGVSCNSDENVYGEIDVNPIVSVSFPTKSVVQAAKENDALLNFNLKISTNDIKNHTESAIDHSGFHPCTTSRLESDPEIGSNFFCHDSIPAQNNNFNDMLLLEQPKFKVRPRRHVYHTIELPDRNDISDGTPSNNHKVKIISSPPIPPKPHYLRSGFNSKLPPKLPPKVVNANAAMKRKQLNEEYFENIRKSMDFNLSESDEAGLQEEAISITIPGTETHPYWTISDTTTNTTQNLTTETSSTQLETPLIKNTPLTLDVHKQRRQEFVDSLKALKQCGWYWGNMSWEDAESMLAQRPGEEGVFLVRDSQDPLHILTLTIRSVELSIHHVRVEHTEGKFQLYDPDRGVSRGAANCVRHPNIVTFIKLAMKHSRSGTFIYFIKTRNMGVPPVQIRLLTPISRFTCVKSLKYYVRFTIRDSVPYDSITNLPIPHDLKEYLLNSPYFDATEDLQCALLS
uniref:Suppressor of cytokine signaling n=1 Tax=Ciona intestinalis TaxID=7719 RepID=F6QHE0_CIOIN